MKLKNFILLSIALHLFMCISIILPYNEQSSLEDNKPSYVSMTDGNNDLLKKPKLVEIIPQSPNQITIKPCTKFYYGIGFTHAGRGRVLEVYEGYPAYNGGLLIGDYVENIDDIPHQDKITFTLKFRRGSVSMVKAFTTAKICIN